MSNFEDRERIIEWGDSHFFITDTGELEVIKNTEVFGMLDRNAWEDAMLDGPIADMRRLSNIITEYQIAGYGFWEEVEPQRVIEKMMLVSRKIFIGGLVELEDYARYYNGGQKDDRLV